jgi:hypothetical protein
VHKRRQISVDRLVCRSLRIKSTVSSGNACCHYVQSHLSSCLPKNFSVVLYGCETLSLSLREEHRLRMYPKVSGLAALSENCKCYRCLSLSAVVSLFCESDCHFCRHNPLYCFSTSTYCCKCIFYRLNPETFGYTLVN